MDTKNSSSNHSGDEQVRIMLSLLRSSHISFPREKVMEEANAFMKEYLNQVLGGLGSMPFERGKQWQVFFKIFKKIKIDGVYGIKIRGFDLISVV